MSNIIVYHNTRCGKSREGVAYLTEKGVDFEVVQYLKSPFAKADLKAVVDKLDISIEELVRKNEAIYKSDYKGKTLSEDEWLEAMIAHPKLIERPIVVVGDKALVARPAARIEELF